MQDLLPPLPEKNHTFPCVYFHTVDCSLAQRHSTVPKCSIFLRGNVSCLAWMSVALWLHCTEDLK